MNKHKKKGVITIYTLELESGKYYVGQSKTPKKRINQHFSGNGSAWTKKFKPIKIIKEIELNTNNWRAALEVEKQLTLKLMVIFGWQNIRGAGWSQLELKSKPRELIHEGIQQINAQD
ncbi:MAG: putative GIY-YIG superfamily endonuclease [Oleiphilaceae bacterium]|jgi:predicted GIY-YIG superfamily endonuclease